MDVLEFNKNDTKICQRYVSEICEYYVLLGGPLLMRFLLMQHFNVCEFSPNIEMCITRGPPVHAIIKCQKMICIGRMYKKNLCMYNFSMLLKKVILILEIITV